MPIRRRPVLRAAAVGSIGYASYKAGKSAAAAPTQQQIPAPAEQAAPPPVASAPAPASQTERIKALAELKGMLDSGAVTQAEFDHAKKGLLEGAPGT
jgi:hypothetical protein